MEYSPCENALHAQVRKFLWAHHCLISINSRFGMRFNTIQLEAFHNCYSMNNHIYLIAIYDLRISSNSNNTKFKMEITFLLKLVKELITGVCKKGQH